MSSDHLAVLVHGLWGSPEHMWCVKESLEEAHPSLHVLVSKTNIGNRTYDGVDVCGERIAKEVQEEVERLRKNGTDVKRISFVGYSFGGLAARYCIGVLQSTGTLDSIKPVNFTTFATPHVGVCPPKQGFFSYLVSSLGPRSLSVTGAHIFLADSLMKNRPLLEVMTDPESTFMKGLSMFQSKALYANIINDRSVPYFTAAISSQDPYQDLTKLRLHTDHECDVLLDSEKPYSIEPDEKILTNTVKPTFREYAFRCVMLIGLPLWITLFLANAIIATFNSSRRINAHRMENPESSPSLSAQLNQEFVEDLIDGSDGETDLKLNSHQTKIVANLNSLKWQKFMVRIQKTQHSHAAIVCRTRDTPRLMEGHKVMQHWIEKVFIR